MYRGTGKKQLGKYLCIEKKPQMLQMSTKNIEERETSTIQIQSTKSILGGMFNKIHQVTCTQRVLMHTVTSSSKKKTYMFPYLNGSTIVLLLVWQNDGK